MVEIAKEKLFNSMESELKREDSNIKLYFLFFSII